MPINNFYSVSSLGRMWSAKIGLMRTPINNAGYPHLSLMVNGKSKRHLVHRLLAFAHIPNPENKPWINHKNGIKTDNRVENLEWCTPSENGQHAIDFLGRKAPKNNHRRKKILAKKEGEKDVEVLGIREIARKLGMPYQAVQNCIKNTRKTYFGWNFKIVGDPKFVSKSGLKY